MPGLLARLDLDTRGPDHFLGTPSPGMFRVYGGEAAAQALVAAGRTVDDDRVPHSIHCHYLTAGDTSRELEYEVERTRDGRSFSTRHVVCRQGGAVVLTSTVSYQRPADGPAHQLPMPVAPAPETLMTLAQAEAADVLGRGWVPWGAHHPEYELRTVPPVLEDPYGRRLYWGRFDVDCDDDPALQAALAVYASDFTMVASIRLPHEPEHRKTHDMTTLSHSVYLHAPFRSTEWHLIEHAAPVAAGSRGLAVSHVYTAGGTLVLSAVQEGLIRPSR